MAGEGGLGGQPHDPSAALSGHGDVAAALAAGLIAPEHNELLAREQIGQGGRVDLRELHRSVRDGQVGQHGVPDLGRQHAQCLLHVLARLDVLRGAAARGGQPVKQVGVHVIAHPEREHTRLPAVGLGLRRDALRVALTDRGESVGQEYDDGQPALIAVQAEGLSQSARYVGPAVGVQPVDPAVRVSQLVRSGPRPALAVRPHPVAERQEPEAVLPAQRAEELPQRSLGLVDLGPGHRARHVEHHRQVAGHRSAVVLARRERQHEVAVLAHGPVRHQGESDQTARHGQEQGEVARELACLPHGEPPVDASHPQLVGGGERIVECRAIGHERERQRHRLGAPPPLGAALDRHPAAAAPACGIAELQRVTCALQHLRIAQRDLAGLPGVDGEDASAQQSVSGQLDEGRVALAADDLLVDGARLRRVHRLAAELLVSLEQREVAEHRLAGERIEVVTLSEAAAFVAEPLLDLHQGHSSRDPDGDGGSHLNNCEALRPIRYGLDPALSLERTGHQDAEYERFERFHSFLAVRSDPDDDPAGPVCTHREWRSLRAGLPQRPDPSILRDPIEELLSG